MLLFIDDLRHIRIVRKSDSDAGREPLGRIRKHDADIPEDLLAKLDAAEQDELRAALALVAAGEQARLKAAIAELPALMHQIVDFYRTDASLVEQRWVRGAVQEAWRLIKGHDHAATDTPAD